MHIRPVRTKRLLFYDTSSNVKILWYSLFLTIIRAVVYQRYVAMLVHRTCISRKMLCHLHIHMYVCIRIQVAYSSLTGYGRTQENWERSQLSNSIFFSFKIWRIFWTQSVNSMLLISMLKIFDGLLTLSFEVGNPNRY